MKIIMSHSVNPCFADFDHCWHWGLASDDTLFVSHVCRKVFLNHTSHLRHAPNSILEISPKKVKRDILCTRGFSFREYDAVLLGYIFTSDGPRMLCPMGIEIFPGKNPSQPNILHYNFWFDFFFLKKTAQNLSHKPRARQRAVTGCSNQGVSHRILYDGKADGKESVVTGSLVLPSQKKSHTFGRLEGCVRNAKGYYANKTQTLIQMGGRK